MSRNEKDTEVTSLRQKQNTIIKTS